MRRCLRVLVLEDADRCHAFDHRDRRGDIVPLTCSNFSDEIFEDNEGAISLAIINNSNPITNSNSKHIDVRHHFLRELVLIERAEIKVIFMCRRRISMPIFSQRH